MKITSLKLLKKLKNNKIAEPVFWLGGKNHNHNANQIFL